MAYNKDLLVQKKIRKPPSNNIIFERENLRLSHEYLHVKQCYKSYGRQRLQDILTPDFSTPKFNPRFFFLQFLTPEFSAMNILTLVV